MNESIRDEFAKLLANNAFMRHAYTRAIKAGLSEEEGLMSLLLEMQRWFQIETDVPLLSAYDDLHTWRCLAKWQRDVMDHGEPWCPTVARIEKTEQIQQAIQGAREAIRR